jgi:hypothetical protein
MQMNLTSGAATPEKPFCVYIQINGNGEIAVTGDLLILRLIFSDAINDLSRI